MPQKLFFRQLLIISFFGWYEWNCVQRTRFMKGRICPFNHFLSSLGILYFIMFENSSTGIMIYEFKREINLVRSVYLVFKSWVFKVINPTSYCSSCLFILTALALFLKDQSWHINTGVIPISYQWFWPSWCCAKWMLTEFNETLDW